VFRKVLVANRGEVACRILRTCRRLGVATVAVHSEAEAAALHVRSADEAVCIGPAPVRDSYLRIDAIIEAARTSGAEAVHPGYGLLSEQAAFARAVTDAGLVFIGPPAGVLEVFGDKLKAKRLAGSQSGSSDALTAEQTNLAQAEAQRIGYPVVVKAVAGGGGIGMQVVHEPGGLARAVRACSDRARSAFGDARVFLERYVDCPRHIEVQVLLDVHGGEVALGERECSVQRRHQKLIEETPSPASFYRSGAGEALRQELIEDALRIVRTAGYVNAGTVEFVSSGAGERQFLEVNARLQVEHPVTEMVTGLDLVELQLRVACGEPVVRDLRVESRGHAIEARIYAEDPSKSFAPQPGRIRALRWPDISLYVRVETGVDEGSELSPHYDPLIAKIIAWGEDRRGAIARLDEALRSTQVVLEGPRGEAATNLGFLRTVLADPGFVRGDYDTGIVGRLTQRSVA